MSAEPGSASTTAAANKSPVYDPSSKLQTRFPRILWPQNPLDQIAGVSVQIDKILNMVTPSLSEYGVAAASVYTVAKTGVTDTEKIPYKPNGDYYSMDLGFAIGKQDAAVIGAFKRTDGPSPAITAEEKKEANWGRAWTPSLVDPHTNCLYLIRCRVQQLRMEPLLAGFTLRWRMPPGWLFADGFGTLTTVEAVSNPLVVIRRVFSPASLPKGTKGGFIVTVAKMYPGY
jgi:hypothetical protein